MRNEGFKFIEAPRPELYDLQFDPAESNDKYDSRDARVKKSRAMLADLRAREAMAQSSKAATAESASTELNALGYPDSTGTESTAKTLDPLSLPDPKDKIEQQNLLHAAMIASEDNRPEDARKSLEKVLALDPKSPTALRQIGEVEFATGDYAQAAQHLKRAVEVRPGDATASFYEGQAMEKMHNLAGARDALETSLKLMPEQIPARLLLGQVCLGLKDPKAAEDQFEAALLLQSDNVEAQLGLANAQLAEGGFAEAAQLLEALSKVEAQNADVFDLLAKAYSGLGKTAEAQRAAAKFRQLRPNK